MNTATSHLVLLVDDDPNDEEFARVAFERTKIPHQLLVKHDGVEVIAWMNALSEDERHWPRLILLDLKLPKVDGLDVMRALRSVTKTKHIPVVVFTSSAEHGDLIQSYALGANAYIRKPVDFSVYRETIADIARFWLLRNHLVPAGSGNKV